MFITPPKGVSGSPINIDLVITLNYAKPTNEKRKGGNKYERDMRDFYRATRGSTKTPKREPNIEEYEYTYKQRESLTFKTEGTEIIWSHSNDTPLLKEPYEQILQGTYNKTKNIIK